jgi:hypothetical protein
MVIDLSRLLLQQLLLVVLLQVPLLAVDGCNLKWMFNNFLELF